MFSAPSSGGSSLVLILSGGGGMGGCSGDAFQPGTAEDPTRDGLEPDLPSEGGAGGGGREGRLRA